MALSTFMGLETTLRGILAQQLALDTTAHNISNASTPGYSRQSAVMAASTAFAPPSMMTPAQAGEIGTGVDVIAYQRVRDSFLDLQYRAQSMVQGQAQATNDGLNNVQDALNEPGANGLSNLMQQYWSSWQAVSNDPENMASRQALAQSAASLANGFNALSSQLTTIQGQTGQNVTSTIQNVNQLGTQIATLNNSIRQATVGGVQPNDLLDQRDNLLDQLSALGNVSITNSTNGMVDVSIGGAALVTGTTSATIAETDMTSLTSGKLSGLIQLRDTTIPGYQSQLDTVASTLISATNTQHAAGFDLNGNAGGAFFTGTSASTIAVNPALITNPGLIAASADGTPGNANNALALAGIRNQVLIGSSSIDDAYSQLVTKIGADTAQSNTTLSNATALTTAINNQRQAVSGVSLDEEMTNLLTFQRGYQASSRALSAMDDMIDQLVNRTGRVGL